MKCCKLNHFQLGEETIKINSAGNKPDYPCNKKSWAEASWASLGSKISELAPRPTGHFHTIPHLSWPTLTCKLKPLLNSRNSALGRATAAIGHWLIINQIWLITFNHVIIGWFQVALKKEKSVLPQDLQKPSLCCVSTQVRQPPRWQRVGEAVCAALSSAASSPETRLPGVSRGRLISGTDLFSMPLSWNYYCSQHLSPYEASYFLSPKLLLKLPAAETINGSCYWSPLLIVHKKEGGSEKTFFKVIHLGGSCSILVSH